VLVVDLLNLCEYNVTIVVGADPFGSMTLKRKWDDLSDSLDNAQRRLRVAFEFMSKLGVKFYTFHDVLVFLLSYYIIHGYTRYAIDHEYKQ